MPSMLIVSNGYGEAAIARYIAREVVRLAPDARVEHFRLVGRDAADAWPPPVGPQQDMPSGGLVTYGNARSVFADLRAGLLSSTLRQFAFLRTQRRRDVLVAVGDVYCLATCLWFARRPTVFVATAKSEYVAGHSRLECWIARHAVVTFARDAPTAHALKTRGVRARWVGNLMMDGVADQPDGALPVDPGALRIGVLPGSRRDAPSNAARAVRRLRLIARALKPNGERLQALVSIADPIAAGEIERAVAAQGVRIDGSGGREGPIVRGHADETNLEIVLASGHFAELLGASELVFGQAGTANEQAAGLGKPVIASSDAGRPPEHAGWYRRRQKRLLGDALLVLPDDDLSFVEGVLRLLDDPARRQHMADAGRERMGQAGGSARVAQSVLALSESSAAA